MSATTLESKSDIAAAIRQKRGKAMRRSTGNISGRVRASVRRTLWLAAVGAAAAGGLTVPAAAQDSTSKATLEEIVVTARKREENLQNTPVAISVFTAEALERQQIISTEDLDRVTPNLQFTSYGPLSGNNSAAQVFIRGIGQTDPSSGVDPGVGLYIDEVYMGRSVGGVMDFRDIANVQVLRGPQGTLFGRNTIGGAVLLSTTMPGREFGGTVRASIGDDNLRDAFAAVDVPLGDALAARFSVGARKRDGYVTRVADGVDLGDENTYTLQTTWRWLPTEDLTLTLRGDYTHEDENGSPFVFAAINENQAFPAAISRGSGCPGATFPPPSVPLTLVDPRCANDATWNLGPFKNGGTAPVESTLTNWGASLTANWKLNDALTLKSITAYRELEWTGKRDADNTALLILHTDYQSDGDQFSQEFQALLETRRLHGVVGVFYFEESIIDFLQVPFAAPPPAVAAAGPNAASRDNQNADLNNENFAVFTQWTFDATDALSLTAGLRYTEETKRIQLQAFTTTPITAATIVPTQLRPYTINASGVPVGSNAIIPGTNSYGLHINPIPFEKTFDSFTGSASVQYRFSDHLMTYASWSQGFKSGGFNQRFNDVTINYIPTSFDEEQAETFEIGIKSEFGGVLRVNAALFQTSYTDMQLIYRVGIVPLLFNAGEATIKGGEVEFTYAPGSLIVEGSLGFLDDSFDTITSVPTATATVGPNNSLPFTPDLQGNIGIGYDFGIGTDLKLTPRVDVSYTDSQFFDAANSVEVAQNESVTVVGFSLSLEGGDHKWRLRAGVNNLTDELYRVAGNSSFSTSSGYAEVIYARPRNYYLTGSYNF
jgi:iron complex outermembrane receptor protein